VTISNSEFAFFYLELEKQGSSDLVHRLTVASTGQLMTN